MPKLTRLSLKQQHFVDAYLGEAKGNGTKAAQIAGYRGSPQTLKAVASENLTKPDIAREIQKALRTVMTSEKVLEELSQIASAECREPVRIGDKLKALDLMGKHHRIFNESANVVVEHLNGLDLAIILQQTLGGLEEGFESHQSVRDAEPSLD
ncbi:MAG: terminase small subunit [Pyrinomonadaceae bacterium]|nr:terminase small subunit [Pyrinomonadaceae bacterium]